MMTAPTQPTPPTPNPSPSLLPDLSPAATQPRLAQVLDQVLAPFRALAHMPAHWRAFAGPFALALLALLLAYRETGLAMVSIWSRSETFAHAYVVPLISLWLIWRKRHELALMTPRPQWWMLLPIAVLSMVWATGQVVVANAVAQLAFTALLVALVPAIFGWAVTWTIGFALAFLFFAVPVGESLTPILMLWTADFTVGALQLSGIPVYREGQQFVIPSGSWSVVEACSGLRYLMASFMVGSLFAYITYTSTAKRVIFIGVSILLPIVANWVRAYMIVMLGHLSNNRLATGVDHLIYGWVFFGIVIMMLFWVGARWAEPDLPTPTGPAVVPAAPTRGLISPAWAMAGALAVVLSITPTWLARRAELTYVAPTLQLPETLAGDWAAVPQADPTAWQPIYVEPSALVQRLYASSAQAQAPVGLHIAYYRQQNAQRKLVNSGNMLAHADDAEWNRVRSGSHTLTLPDQTLTVNSAEILGRVPSDGRPRARLLVWQWYWVGGRLVQGDVAAKFSSVWQWLAGQADESASVILYVRADDNGPAGGAKSDPARLRAMEAFMSDNWRTIDARLRATAGMQATAGAQ